MSVSFKISEQEVAFITQQLASHRADSKLQNLVLLFNSSRTISQILPQASMKAIKLILMKHSLRKRELKNHQTEN